MSISFNDYYLNYLGLKNNFIHSNKKIIIIKSVFRDYPINRKFFYPLISTEYQGKEIFSCSQKLNIPKATSKEHLQFNEILNRNPDLLQKYMYRFTKERDNEKRKTSSQLLTKTLIDKIEFNSTAEKEIFLERKKAIITQKRQYVLIKNKTIISTAFLSDIYCQGANIVVYTNPNFWGRGYGREVVRNCINWCFENNLIPVYLVNKENKASIKLALSLKFKLKCKERVLFHQSTH